PHATATPRPPPTSTPFPYTTLFRSGQQLANQRAEKRPEHQAHRQEKQTGQRADDRAPRSRLARSVAPCPPNPAQVVGGFRAHGKDRKSTRLNSSHVKISYAVFCLKK